MVLNTVFIHLFTLWQVEKVKLETQFPKSVLSVTLTPSQGRYTFDPTSKIMMWDVGDMEPGKIPNIKGQCHLVKTTHKLF